MPSDTSSQAYHEVKEDGTEETQIQRIHAALLKHGACSSRMIERVTKVEAREVCARLANMEKNGLAVRSSKDVCPITGKRVQFWKAFSREVDPHVLWEQSENVNKVLEASRRKRGGR